jgi:hypothetical protein
MALGDLFKSKQDRERDQNKKRRKAFREAENAVDVVKDRVSKLKKERDKAWGEAREYLKNGQKGAAQRNLQTCRAAEMLMAKLEMKRWVFEQLLTKLELAKTDQEFAGALAAINTVVHIDPEAVADVLGEVEDKLGDQVDTDKIWEKMYGKEMEGVQTQMTDVIPSIDEMEKQLEDEVAADLGAEKPSRARAKAKASDSEPSVKEQIGEARQRLKKLLEEDK